MRTLPLLAAFFCATLLGDQTESVVPRMLPGESPA
jgi:hypothetical protein